MVSVVCVFFFLFGIFHLTLYSSLFFFFWSTHTRAGLYALLKDLLSAQKHYDWGLRAVKSVLRVAGTMLRAEPELDEAAILMRALRDSNTAKIIQEDEPM